MVVGGDMQTPQRNPNGSLRRFSASTPEAAALQSYRTFMRSAEGRAIAKRKWSSFPRRRRAQDVQLRAAQEAAEAAVAQLMATIKLNLSQERVAKTTLTWTGRVAKVFLSHCRPSTQRRAELRRNVSSLTEADVDEVLLQATRAWWATFNRPLQHEEDDRFLYNFYCLVHVRPQEEAETPPVTFLCCFHRITRPSFMEFMEAITYKTHQRKIPMEVAAGLSGSQDAARYVQKVKNEMTAKHDPAVPQVSSKVPVGAKVGKVAKVAKVAKAVAKGGKAATRAKKGGKAAQRGKKGAKVTME